MSSLLRLVQLVVVASSVTACASMTVGSHVERGLDFSHYRTYEWVPPDALPAGDARLLEDLEFLDHMQGAIEKALAARGYRRVTFGGPDLLVHYHAAVSRRIDVDRLDRERGQCYAAECRARVIDDETATLVLDIVDARTEQLVWRGWARENLDTLLSDHRRMARDIGEAVQKMVAQLPGGF
jgi:Domain of unknown function (DUF4136)